MKEDIKMDKEQVSFEQAMEQLDSIVQKLEHGNVSLDEALELFEKGVKLISFCQEKITFAEQKVSILVQNNKEIFLEPLDNKEVKE
jgi:exodeoxyribonuclease VII small subunit